MSNPHGTGEMLETRLEKALSMHIYLVRRSLFYWVRWQLWKAEKASELFDFYVVTELDDRESWKWFKDWKFPRYRVEKENGF